MPNCLYLFLCWLIYIISLPFLIAISFQTKHKDSIPARFFGRQKIDKSFNPTLWFHACSFGEVKSLEPILCALLESSQHKILLSVITQTGYNLAKQTYKDNPNIYVCFLPFEIFLPFFTRTFTHLKRLIVTEAELWLELFISAKKLNAQTLLINARISTRSYPKYKRFSFFYRKLFSYVDIVLAQSISDKQNLESIGAKNVSVFPNLKIFSTPAVSKSYPKPQKLSLIAASTHQGEEELILEAFTSLQKHQPCILFLAPRHPERFDIVADMLQKNSYHFARLTEGFRDDVDVLLVDTLMELNNFYAIGDITILGGAFAKVGGHNPLEPAYFHNKLISGEHIFNQRALFECVEHFVLVSEQNLQSQLLAHSTMSQSQIKNHQSQLPLLLSIITKDL